MGSEAFRQSMLALLIAWGIALVINVVPAFMLPTWSVLAIIHVTSDQPLLLLTVGGAAASACGRILLALGSRGLGGHLPKKDRENAEALGELCNRHRRWREAIFFGYCLAPLPSNPLFIAAGVGRVALLPVVLAFFAARAIADTFWVWTAGKISEGAGSLFKEQLTSWKAIVVQIAALLVVVMLFRLPWVRWLGARKGRGGSQPGSRASEARSQSAALMPAARGKRDSASS
jgi:membrane protein YqaA with SNARE-associated domain